MKHARKPALKPVALLEFQRIHSLPAVEAPQHSDFVWHNALSTRNAASEIPAFGSCCGTSAMAAVPSRCDTPAGIRNLLLPCTLATSQPCKQSLPLRLRLTASVSRARCLQILNRVNVFNGRRYAEDPAILGWDILNEPRDPLSSQPPGKIPFGDFPALSMSHLMH